MTIFRSILPFRLLNMLPMSSPANLSFENFDDAVSKKFKLKKYLSKLLSENYKNCLLVLLDVPNQMALKSFDLQCKILMTTRNKEVRFRRIYGIDCLVDFNFSINSCWICCQAEPPKLFNCLKASKLTRVWACSPKSWE